MYYDEINRSPLRYQKHGAEETVKMVHKAESNQRYGSHQSVEMIDGDYGKRD